MSKIEWKSEKRLLKDFALICKTCQSTFKSKKLCKSRLPKYCSKECYRLSLLGKKPNEKQLYALKIGRTYPHSNKGSHWSEQSRLKLSKTKKGIKLTIEHKQSLSLAKKGNQIKHFMDNWETIKSRISKALMGKPQPWNRGKNHHNWQGGITPLNFKIRNSFEYKQWRREVFKRDDFTCQVCSQRGGRLVADHIKPFSLYPELRTNLENGRTLCKECDLKSDTYGGRAVGKAMLAN